MRLSDWLHLQLIALSLAVLLQTTASNALPSPDPVSLSPRPPPPVAAAEASAPDTAVRSRRTITANCDSFLCRFGGTCTTDPVTDIPSCMCRPTHFGDHCDQLTVLGIETVESHKHYLLSKFSMGNAPLPDSTNHPAPPQPSPEDPSTLLPDASHFPFNRTSIGLTFDLNDYLNSASSFGSDELQLSLSPGVKQNSPFIHERRLATLTDPNLLQGPLAPTFTGITENFYESAQNYANSLVAQASIGINLGLFSFSVSSRFSSESAREQSVSLAEFAIRHKLASYTLAPGAMFNMSILTDNFITACHNLRVQYEITTMQNQNGMTPCSGASNAYSNFVDTYGSHIATSINVGGTIESSVSDQSITSLDETRLRVEAKASYLGLISAHTSAEYNTSTSASTALHKSVFRIVGGTNKTAQAVFAAHEQGSSAIGESGQHLVQDWINSMFNPDASEASEMMTFTDYTFMPLSSLVAFVLRSTNESARAPLVQAELDKQIGMMWQKQSACDLKLHGVCVAGDPAQMAVGTLTQLVSHVPYAPLYFPYTDTPAPYPSNLAFHAPRCFSRNANVGSSAHKHADDLGNGMPNTTNAGEDPFQDKFGFYACSWAINTDHCNCAQPTLGRSDSPDLNKLVGVADGSAIEWNPNIAMARPQVSTLFSFATWTQESSPRPPSGATCLVMVRQYVNEGIKASNMYQIGALYNSTDSSWRLVYNVLHDKDFCSKLSSLPDQNSMVTQLQASRVTSEGFLLLTDEDRNGTTAFALRLAHTEFSPFTDGGLIRAYTLVPLSTVNVSDPDPHFLWSLRSVVLPLYPNAMTRRAAMVPAQSPTLSPAFTSCSERKYPNCFQYDGCRSVEHSKCPAAAVCRSDFHFHNGLMTAHPVCMTNWDIGSDAAFYTRNALTDTLATRLPEKHLASPRAKPTCIEVFNSTIVLVLGGVRAGKPRPDPFLAGENLKESYGLVDTLEIDHMRTSIHNGYTQRVSSRPVWIFSDAENVVGATTLSISFPQAVPAPDPVYIHGYGNGSEPSAGSLENIKIRPVPAGLIFLVGGIRSGRPLDTSVILLAFHSKSELRSHLIATARDQIELWPGRGLLSGPRAYVGAACVKTPAASTLPHLARRSSQQDIGGGTEILIVTAGGRDSADPFVPLSESDVVEVTVAIALPRNQWYAEEAQDAPLEIVFSSHDTTMSHEYEGQSAWPFASPEDSNAFLHNGTIPAHSLLHMNESRAAPGVAILGDKVFVAGGWRTTLNGGHTLLTTTEVLHLPTLQWTTGPPLSHGRVDGTAVHTVGPYILVSGGSSEANATMLDLFRLRNLGPTMSPQLVRHRSIPYAHPRRHAASCTHADRFVIFAGGVLHDGTITGIIDAFAQEHLTRLRVVHLSGTKGKGSTSAMAESMLRTCGARTGFFSSPHLIEVRERIRLNGRPISRELFAQRFWETWTGLGGSRSGQKAPDRPMPPYFRFLTLMALHTFVEERVDAVVLEVGLGGRYDSTNIIDSPTVCGTCSLGHDHEAILGDTISKIAHQKGGIYKRNVPCVSVPQPEDGFAVLMECARAQGTSLMATPPLEAYEQLTQRPIALGLSGTFQRVNAALALSVVSLWLQQHHTAVPALTEWARDFGATLAQHASSDSSPPLTSPHSADPSTSAVPGCSYSRPFVVPSPLCDALRDCRWPGRAQTLSTFDSRATVYLDGAHTPESIQVCADWYAQVEQQHTHPAQRILLFNCSGDREFGRLVGPLAHFQFDQVLFCPNIQSTQPSEDSDNANNTVDWTKIDSRTEEIEQTFLSATHHPTMTRRFRCIQDAVEYVEALSRNTVGGDGEVVRVLVTGSLHLVGGVLTALNVGVQ